MMQVLPPLLLLSPLLLRVRGYQAAQCYWAAGEELPFEDLITTNSYLPCGDTDQGTQSCCRVGHICLDNNACYGPEVGMVYTAGCTDSDYTSSQCPSKCDSDVYWVGHSYCNGTSNKWSCCDNQFGDSKNDELYPFRNDEACWCPEEGANIAFAAPSKVADVALLDLNDPGEISYFPGQAPKTDDNDAASTSSQNDRSGAGATRTGDTLSTFAAVASTRTGAEGSDSAAATGEGSPDSENDSTSPTAVADLDSNDPSSSDSSSSDSSSDSSSNSLSTGSKVGIGVGAAIGILLLFALAFLLFLRRRKHRQQPAPPIQDQIRPKSFGSYVATSEVKPSSEGANGEFRSPAWSGHKPELPASERPRHSGMAEVEADTPRASTQSRQPPGYLGHYPGESSKDGQLQPPSDANGNNRRYYGATQQEGRDHVHEMPE